MANEIQFTGGFLVVSESVLPEVFSKVLEVKRLLANREEKSSAAACKRIGISRSAYYKYRGCVFSYEEKLMQRVITLYASLKDKPGVLSNLLAAIHSMDANILTLNQSIPIDGVASVTVSIKLGENSGEPNSIKAALASLNGVIEVRILSGE